MPDEIQEWRQVRDEAKELFDHADKKVAEGEAEQAALEGGVTDAEAKRRRRGMGAVVWPVAAVLASWAEAIRTNQEAVMQFAFGGTAAASVAVAMVLQPPLYQPPQASDGTPRPVMVRPYVPAPPSTARAEPRPAAPADISEPAETAKPKPEPTPTEITPTETAPPAGVTADAAPAVDPPADPPKVKVKPKVTPPKLVDNECLVNVDLFDGQADCPNS